MANEQNRKEPGRKSEAREMQKKSAEKRKQNTREKKLIKDRILERMGEDDWDAMIDNLIAEAKGSVKGFETLRDTIGQKPTDKVELSIDDESAREIDEYFAERYNTPVGE